MKSDSFYDADSVTLLATEVALRAHGAHLCHFTYGPVHTIYIQICRCFVRIFFFFFVTKLVLEWVDDSQLTMKPK